MIIKNRFFCFFFEKERKKIKLQFIFLFINCYLTMQLKIKYIIIISYLSFSFVFSQSKRDQSVDEESPTPVSFPYNFTGKYFGNLKVSNNIKLLSNIPTEFSLLKSEENDSEFVYQLKFIGKGEKETKKYTLVIVNEEKGFYVIKDENGMEFMGVLIEDTLYSTFELDDKMTFTSLRFTNSGEVYLKIMLSKKVKKSKNKNNKLINSNVVLLQQAKFTR